MTVRSSNIYDPYGYVKSYSFAEIGAGVVPAVNANNSNGVSVTINDIRVLGFYLLAFEVVTFIVDSGAPYRPLQPGLDEVFYSGWMTGDIGDDLSQAVAIGPGGNWTRSVRWDYIPNKYYNFDPALYVAGNNIGWIFEADIGNVVAGGALVWSTHIQVTFGFSIIPGGGVSARAVHDLPVVDPVNTDFLPG